MNRLLVGGKKKPLKQKKTEKGVETEVSVVSVRLVVGRQGFQG